MLPTTTPPGSEYRFFYDGPVGVSGADVLQAFDISSLPSPARSTPSFADNWIVFVRQVDPGVTDVSESVDFTADKKGLIIKLTAANTTDRISLEAWYMPSPVR